MKRYCAFYSYKDMEKLEKFLHGKPLAEQEVGMQLLQEVVGYAETSMSRRKYILHYWGALRRGEQRRGRHGRQHPPPARAV